MKTLKMLVELNYDDELMHGTDKEATNWFFNDILKHDTLILNSNEIGDEVGIIKIIKIKFTNIIKWKKSQS